MNRFNIFGFFESDIWNPLQITAILRNCLKALENESYMLDGKCRMLFAPVAGYYWMERKIAKKIEIVLDKSLK